MTEILLKAEKLKKVFTAGKKSFAAVDEVSFELKRGQCLGIVGESGSGKSTVARLITGLLPCTEGKVLFYPSSEGTEAGCIDISQAGIRQLKQAYRHMQMVFQMPAESFDPRRTLGDGIGESLRNMGIKGTELKQRWITFWNCAGLRRNLLPGTLIRSAGDSVRGLPLPEPCLWSRSLLWPMSLFPPWTFPFRHRSCTCSESSRKNTI